MPGMDRTGPTGLGPATGWGRGPCRLGFRRGFGRRAPIYQEPVLTKTQEKQILEAELQEIEAEKKEILKRLKELK